MQTILVNGDCMHEVEKLQPMSVNMILVDPPYGMTRNIWDVPVPMQRFIEFEGARYEYDGFMKLMYKRGVEYLDALKMWDDSYQNGMWDKYAGVLAPNGVVVVFSAGKYTQQMMTNPGIPWRYNLVWHKTKPAGFLNANRMPLRAHEDICVFYEKLPTYNPQKTSGHTRKVATKEHKRNSKLGSNYGTYEKVSYDSTERFPTSILTFATDQQQGVLHPTQKPVALMKNLILTFTNEGDTVLDNCMGSGSTGVAAMRTGRNFIGIEKDKNIFDTAQERILRAKEDGKVEKAIV